MARPKRRNRRERRGQAQTPPLPFPFKLTRNPLPPIEWASPQQLDQLHEASMHILENIGVDFLDEEALQIWDKAGAKVDIKRQHVWIDRGLLLETVAKAPSTFIWQAPNSARNLRIGGDSINFMPPAGMPYVSDLADGRRPAQLADLEKITKLSHLCGAIHAGGGPHCEPQDIPTSLRHLRRMKTYAAFTDKALRDVAHGRLITADNIEMSRIIFGGELPKNPVFGAMINVNSPLRYDDRMLGGLISLARAGQYSVVTPFIMAGAMSPITIAAALAQQNAEALAGIALTQLVRPGAPVVYGGFTMNADMRSGSPAFGSPEGAWATFVGGQLARRYGLPYRSSGSLTNAKTADAQAAYETQWSLWPAVLSHANMIHHAVGWLEAGLTLSYEKFVIDLEAVGMFAHLLSGFPVDDEALALESVAEVGSGGHHFGTAHTRSRYETAFYQPFLADRDNFEGWRNAGEEDAQSRAHRLWQQALAGYQPPPVDPAMLEELDAFAAKREAELAGVELYT